MFIVIYSGPCRSGFVSTGQWVVTIGSAIKRSVQFAISDLHLQKCNVLETTPDPISRPTSDLISRPVPHQCTVSSAVSCSIYHRYAITVALVCYRVVIFIIQPCL